MKSQIKNNVVPFFRFGFWVKPRIWKSCAYTTEDVAIYSHCDTKVKPSVKQHLFVFYCFVLSLAFATNFSHILFLLILRKNPENYLFFILVQ